MASRNRSGSSPLLKLVLGLLALLLILVIVETVIGILFGTVSWFLSLFGPLGPLVALVGVALIVLRALDVV